MGSSNSVAVSDDNDDFLPAECSDEVTTSKRFDRISTRCETAVVDSGSDPESNRSNGSDKTHTPNQTKLLPDFPNFFAALEQDESCIIACFDSFKRVEYLSNSAFNLLGCDRPYVLDYPRAPQKDTVYYREHVDGTLVQFQNTFLAEMPTGEVYSIDKVIPNPLTEESLHILQIIANGDITRVYSSRAATPSNYQKKEDIVGQNILRLVEPSDANSVSEALASASFGKCSYNVAAKIINSGDDVMMDVFPCSNGHGQAVVLVTSLSAVESLSVYSGNDENNGTDNKGIDVRSQLDLAQMHSYSICRRLCDLGTEVKYLQDYRDNSVLPMRTIGPGGIIMWANHAMLKMMGYSDDPSGYVGSNDDVHHVDKSVAMDLAMTVLRGGSIIDRSVDLIRKDGEIINVIFNGNAKFDANGVFSHTRCTIIDFTERIRLQNAVVELEKCKVEAEAAERAAITASRTKSQFLAVMSHEIRTPINGVIGASSLLSTSTLNDEQVDYVNIISDSAGILLSLVNNILDISKIEQGKFELDEVPLRLADHVRKCATVIKNRADEKGISLTTSIDKELDGPDVWFHCDPTRLNQVLLNFLSNAVKFTRTGGVACKLIKLPPVERCSAVSSHSLGGKETVSNGIISHFSPSSTVGSISVVETHSDLIRLEITDTGCGIADCSILFAAFVQASKSVQQEYGGTGLGLNISKTIIEMMHGRVGIESIVGVGTTVWAEIPMRRAPIPRKGPLTFNSLQRGLHQSTSSTDVVGMRPMIKKCNSGSIDESNKVRILIAEDNSVNQKVLKRMLETIGYSDITIAWNGKEAVDSVVESWDGYLACSSSSAAVVSLFDIVLMDCMMPEMDGWEATREIRKLEKDMLSKAATLSGDSPGYSNVKPTVVIALTANATEEDKIKCNEAGMDDFYVKPMNIDGVQAMMLHWVSKLFSDSSVGNDLEFE